MATVVAQQNETVDALAWRVAGTTAIVPDILRLNPGLAALGPFLPLGTRVVMPETTTGSVKTKTRITLWS
jgi:phage tail protein X